MKLRVGGELTIEIIEDEKPRLIFSVTIGGIRIEDIRMLVLPIDMKAPASVQPVDAAGNPAKVDGVPLWTSSAESIATVVPSSSDGLSADIIATGAIGTCQINVTADVDLGTGTKTISGLLDVQTVAGEAVGLQITTGAPVPKSP